MTLSELIQACWGSLKLPPEISKILSQLNDNILTLEVKQADNVCKLSFYPWFRSEDGAKFLKNLPLEYEDFSYSCNNLYIYICRDCERFYLCKLVGDNIEESEISNF